MARSRLDLDSGLEHQLGDLFPLVSVEAPHIIYGSDSKMLLKLNRSFTTCHQSLRLDPFQPVVFKNCLTQIHSALRTQRLEVSEILLAHWVMGLHMSQVENEDIRQPNSVLLPGFSPILIEH
jgi:hypothetical protein